MEESREEHCTIFSYSEESNDLSLNWNIERALNGKQSLRKSRRQNQDENITIKKNSTTKRKNFTYLQNKNWKNKL